MTRKQASNYLPLFSFALLALPPLKAETLSVSVSHQTVAPNTTIICAVFDREQDFLDTPIKSLKINATGSGVTEFSIELTPNKAYALSLYLDINDNGKLDTSFFGIPSEPVGTSNNAPAKFGPPSYEDAQFTVEEGTGSYQSITLANVL